MPVDADPWEQLDGESFKAYQAFLMYRDLGLSRTLRGTAGHLGKNRKLIEGWSSKNNWVVRARAFDSHVDVSARQKIIDDRIEMLDQHARIARLMTNRVAARLVGDGATEAFNPSELSAKDIPAWIKVAVDVERISRGEATARTEAVEAESQPGGVVPERTDEQRVAAMRAKEEVGLVSPGSTEWLAGQLGVENPMQEILPPND